MIEVEKIIPDTLQRLQTTGNDTQLLLVEENKDGNGDLVNRGRVNDWRALGVNILIENMDPHEKVELLAAAISQVKNIG